MRRATPRKTIVEALFENPRTFNNDEIKVWIEGQERDDRSCEGIKEYYDSLPANVILELLPASDAVDFAPGQPYIYLRGGHGGLANSQLLTFPATQPYVDLPNGRFVRTVYCREYKGLPLGGGRPLRAAVRRALA